MKKKTALSIIAIMTVIAIIFGSLFFSTRSRLNGQIMTLENTLVDITKQNENLSKEIAVKGDQIDDLSIEVENRNLTIEERELSIKGLEQSLSEAELRLSSLSESIKQKETELSVSKEENESKAAKITSLKQELEDKNQTINNYKIEAQNNIERITALNTAIDEQVEQIEKLKRQIGDLSAGLQEKEAYIKTLEDSNSSLESDLEKKTLVIKDFEDSIEKLRVQIKELEKQISNSEQNVNDSSETSISSLEKLKIEARLDSDAVYSTIYSYSQELISYKRTDTEEIHMPVAGEYSRMNMGVLTFRGDAFRQNAAAGTVQSAKELSVAWQVEAGSARGASQTYYGIGWTGQPAIVKWSKEVREKSSLYESKIEKVGLKEVIIAGMDGVIYFLDLDDGSLTRNKISLGYPMRGTPSVHPSGFPYMSVGQFARKMKSKTGSIGLRQYNLYSGKEMSLIDGLDGKLHRAYNNIGSFETSALIDRTTDTLITAGSNGLLYLINLNSYFDYMEGKYLQNNPSAIVLKSKGLEEKKDSFTSVESSLAMYDQYIFFADMGGMLRCVDANTLKTLWSVETGDAVEAAIALNFNNEDGLDLYTGNMLINRNEGAAQIRCFDALKGTARWLLEIPVRKDTKTRKEVGIKASPLIGMNQLRDLVYFTVTGISEEGRNLLNLTEDIQSVLLALDQETGNIVWTCGMKCHAESSPVAVYDEAGQGWVIQAAENGEILLMEGRTGEVVNCLKIDGEIEASPAVYNDIMVIGTTGKDTSYIYGIRISANKE